MYLTRNQAYRKVPWVRIPPSPPGKPSPKQRKLLGASAFGMGAAHLKLSGDPGRLLAPSRTAQRAGSSLVFEVQTQDLTPVRPRGRVAGRVRLDGLVGDRSGLPSRDDGARSMAARATAATGLRVRDRAASERAGELGAELGQCRAKRPETFHSARGDQTGGLLACPCVEHRRRRPISAAPRSTPACWRGEASSNATTSATLDCWRRRRPLGDATARTRARRWPTHRTLDVHSVLGLTTLHREGYAWG